MLLQYYYRIVTRMFKFAVVARLIGLIEVLRKKYITIKATFSGLVRQHQLPLSGKDRTSVYIGEHTVQ